jgi:hypothetical protein
MDRYIGLDAHASSCTVGPSGRRLHWHLGSPGHSPPSQECRSAWPDGRILWDQPVGQDRIQEAWGPRERKRRAGFVRSWRPLRPFFRAHRPPFLDVETHRIVSLDVRGGWWTHRSPQLTERPAGLHLPGGRDPAPNHSVIAGAGLRPPRFTASSGNTSRPTSPWPTRPIPWATACRIMSRRSSGAT